MTNYDVILGATAFSETTEEIDSRVRILGLDQQTTGRNQSAL